MEVWSLIKSPWLNVDNLFLIIYIRRFNHIKPDWLLLISLFYLLSMQTQQEGLQSSIEDCKWLFSPRLQFTGAASCFLSRISDHSLLQGNKNSKKEPSLLSYPISSHFDIQRTLDLANTIIYDCRFNQSNLNVALSKSRNELRARKQVKQVEKNCKAKVKRYLELVQLPEKEEEHWRLVLSHKNILQHLYRLYLLLAELLSKNYDLIQGVYSLRDKSLSLPLQVKICIIVTDILSAISQMRFAFVSHNVGENDEGLKKFEQQQDRIMEDYFSSAEWPEPQYSYQTLKNLRLQKFSKIINFLVPQLDPSYNYLAAWAGIFNIKSSYLIDGEGMWKFRFDSKLQSTCIQEVTLYWMHLFSKYFGDFSSQVPFSFKPVFQEYRYMFDFFKKEAAANPEKIQSVTGYLFLIEEVWAKLDPKEGSLLFCSQLAQIGKKIVLPLNFLRLKKQGIIRMVESILENDEEINSQHYLTQIKEFMLDLSKELVNLPISCDLTTSYFSIQQDRLLSLLAKRKAFITKISYKREKLNPKKQQKKENSTQGGQLQSEQSQKVEKQQQVPSEEMKKQNQLLPNETKPTEQQQILSLLDLARDKIQEDPLNNFSIISIAQAHQIIEASVDVFEDEKDLAEELHYFLLLASSFSQKPQQKSLRQCEQFYQSKREAIMLPNSLISPQRINNLRFGIMDSIRVLTFELVATISLDKEQGLDGTHFKSKQQQLEKYLSKLLRVYKLKVQQKQREEDLQQRQEQEGQDVNPSSLLLKRSSSYDLDPNNFSIEEVELSTVEQEEIKEDSFSMNLFKKIYQLKIDVINKKLQLLEEQERPLREQYEEIKGKIYKFAAGQEKDKEMSDDISKLPQIEYDFLRKKYYQAWRKLRNLNSPIEDILKILESSLNSKSIFKTYATIYCKYKQHQMLSLNRQDAGELKEENLERFISQCLEIEPKVKGVKQKNGKVNQESKDNLMRALKILENIEMISTLKKQRDQQQEKLQTMEQAKQYRSEKEELKFKQLQGRLEISSVFKNDTPIMKRYTILKVEGKDFEEILSKLRKLARLNRTISVKPDKQKGSITMEVDEQQLSFQCYPKLIKYLIESYLQIIEFCDNQLHFSLYPLVLHKHIKIGKKHETHIPLKFYPYEGILLNIIFNYKELKAFKLYHYPQFPFIELADQLNSLIFKGKDRIYDAQRPCSQFYAFKHLVQEMKALSMQVEEGMKELVKKILKCPYFWSSTDKLFQLVEFKQRYQSNINIEESRRKENERIRSELQTQEELEAFTPERKHPLYKSASGYNKTTQYYFSIEGLLEKQAFEEDIGSFRENDADYKYHAYWWIKDKTEIERLIEMVSERERRKGCRKATVYEKTFNSFQNQIRNLRNLAVHYIYDDQKKREIDLQEKLSIFEMYFPKLFIFLYRWRPFLGKDYINEIKQEKIKFLKELFSKEDSRQVFKRLEENSELARYNIKNFKGYLLKYFGYQFARINGCDPCKILCNSLNKQQSLWSFLEDVKRVKLKEGKDMTFNLLFWEHDKKGCNGMKALQKAFYNVKQRNQFTTEQFSHVKSSLTLLQVEKERLENKIKKQQQKEQRKAERARLHKNTMAEEIQGGEEDSSSEESTKDVETKKQPVERRLNTMTSDQKQELYDQMSRTDYVCKYFIFQLQMKLPYLFHDLRKERYQWDDRATQFPKEAL